MVGNVAKEGPDLGVRGREDASAATGTADTAGTAGTSGISAGVVDEVGSVGRRASPSSRSRLRLVSPLFRLVDMERPRDVGRDWGPMPWLPSALRMLGPRAGGAKASPSGSLPSREARRWGVARRRAKRRS